MPIPVYPPGRSADLLRLAIGALRADEHVRAFVDGEVRRIYPGKATDAVDWPTGVAVSAVTGRTDHRGKAGKETRYLIQATPWMSQPRYDRADPLELNATHDWIAERLGNSLGPGIIGLGKATSERMLRIEDPTARVTLPARWRFRTMIPDSN